MDKDKIYNNILQILSELPLDSKKNGSFQKGFIRLD